MQIAPIGAPSLTATVGAQRLASFGLDDFEQIQDILGGERQVVVLDRNESRPKGGNLPLDGATHASAANSINSLA